MTHNNKTNGCFLTVMSIVFAAGLIVLVYTIRRLAKGNKEEEDCSKVWKWDNTDSIVTICILSFTLLVDIIVYILYSQKHKNVSSVSSSYTTSQPAHLSSGQTPAILASNGIASTPGKSSGGKKAFTVATPLQTYSPTSTTGTPPLKTYSPTSNTSNSTTGTPPSKTFLQSSSSKTIPTSRSQMATVSPLSSSAQIPSSMIPTG